jgi:hypothetical protein
MNQDSSFSERSILLFILENCIPLPPLCQAVKVVCYLNLKSGHYKAQKWTAEFFNIQGFKVEKWTAVIKAMKKRGKHVTATQEI